MSVLMMFSGTKRKEGETMMIVMKASPLMKAIVRKEEPETILKKTLSSRR